MCTDTHTHAHTHTHTHTQAAQQVQHLQELMAGMQGLRWVGLSGTAQAGIASRKAVAQVIRQGGSVSVSCISKQKTCTCNVNQSSKQASKAVSRHCNKMVICLRNHQSKDQEKNECDLID